MNKRGISGNNTAQESELLDPLLLERVRDRVAIVVGVVATVDTRFDLRSGASRAGSLQTLLPRSSATSSETATGGG